MQHNINKILFLISLPQTPEFQSYSKEVRNCIAELELKGVDCFEAINPELLSKADEYDLVIVIAHKSEKRDALVLADGFLSINDFINSLPPSFKGVLDFSSCYSANAMERIKKRCPNCLVHASIRQTTLPLRLFMYPIVIEALEEERDKTYDMVYSEVKEALMDAMRSSSSSQHGQILGKKYSSIYAPSTVKRQRPFLVQVFFHEVNESSVADLQAERIDPSTEKKDRQILPLNFKKNDNISVKLCFISPAKEFIQLEDGPDTKHIFWLGQMTKVQFCATVMDGFPYDSFVGKLMMEVNSIPIGECYFNINVSEKEAVSPAEIKIDAHDFERERNEAKKTLLFKLSENLSKLQSAIQEAQDPEERSRLTALIQVCSNCIAIIKEEPNKTSNVIKKVFVSSTSDMKLYRDIVRQEIEACNMFPEMYENWPQADSTPKDECCRRVINSDIFFCILGSRYGFVEPTLGMSMTEIEYRTALESGKTILVCISEPIKESDEPIQFAKKQKELIEEIRNTRILKFFSDENTLAKDAARNLSRLTI